MGNVHNNQAFIVNFNKNPSGSPEKTRFLVVSQQGLEYRPWLNPTFNHQNRRGFFAIPQAFGAFYASHAKRNLLKIKKTERAAACLNGLLIRWSQVRIPHGLPIKSSSYGDLDKSGKKGSGGFFDTAIRPVARRQEWCPSRVLAPDNHHIGTKHLNTFLYQHIY